MITAIAVVINSRNLSCVECSKYDWLNIEEQQWFNCPCETMFLYPEWPHRQCVGLAIRRSHVRGSLGAVSLVICRQHSTVQYVELWGYYPVYGGGYDQSIGSTVCDAIVHSWLWSTASRSSPLGYFSKSLQVVDN